MEQKQGGALQYAMPALAGSSASCPRRAQIWLYTYQPRRKPLSLAKSTRPYVPNMHDLIACRCPADSPQCRIRPIASPNIALTACKQMQCNTPSTPVPWCLQARCRCLSPAAAAGRLWPPQTSAHSCLRMRAAAAAAPAGMLRSSSRCAPPARMQACQSLPAPPRLTHVDSRRLSMMSHCSLL